MSGGQMQRVAIARAIVNNPDIILADEPTGALDTETSVQVMDILKELSKDKLVIMVTHNPELAEKYSTRIVRMLDGKITGDSAPFTDEEQKKADEIFENVAYIMAYHADPTIPGTIDEWLEQFEMFSIYEVLPEILDLWGTNLITDVQSKKNLKQAAGK